MKKLQKRVNQKKGTKNLIWIIAGVLLVSLIVAGVFIFKNMLYGTNTGGLTEQQLKIELNNSLSGNTRIAFYPTTKLIEVTQDSSGWVGLGIKNTFAGTANNTFSYNVALSKVSGCGTGVSKETAESWITTGKTGNNLSIPQKNFFMQKIFVAIPKNASLCTVRYGVFVKVGAATYTNGYFDVKIKAK